MDNNTLAKCFLQMDLKKQAVNVRNVVDLDARMSEKTVVLNNQQYEFICILYHDNTLIRGIAYLNNLMINGQSIVENEEEYEETDDKWENPIIVKTIRTNIDPKKYCIELFDKSYNGSDITIINWIQSKSYCDVPNVPGTDCNGLSGIMKLITTFLNSIGFNGPIYLDDDSRFNAVPTIIPRLLIGRDSIYASYGFKVRNAHGIDKLINDLKNATLNGTKLTDLIKQHMDNNNRFLPSLGNFYNQMLGDPNVREIINKITSQYLNMKNDNIYNHVTQSCNALTGGYNNSNNDIFYHKYIKYKTKYLSEKNRNY